MQNALFDICRLSALTLTSSAKVCGTRSKWATKSRGRITARATRRFVTG